MSLRVVGAGLARTGTLSLKLALEHLLGGAAYHMLEVFALPPHIRVWHDAIRGQMPDWDVFFDGYQAAIDLPASAFWQELATGNPDALVILSVRDDPEQWWESVSHTLLDPTRPEPAPGTPMAEFVAMATDLWEVRLGAGDMTGKEAMISAYLRHNDAVRTQAPKERLLEWRPSEGWGPIVDALGMQAPAEPFPWVNTREQFRIPAFWTRPELRRSDIRP
jgi:hypothetical protein